MTYRARGSLPETQYVDGVGPFLTFWGAHAGESSDAVADAWRADYHDLLPADIRRSLERHRYPDDLAVAIPRMATAVGDFTWRGEMVRRAAVTAIEVVSTQMDVRISPFRMTTLVGLFGADGWMDWEDDVAHLLVAVEALESIEQGDILVHHEVVHVAYQQLLADSGIRDVGDALFEEGLATAVPGMRTDLDAGMLCWVGRRTTSTGEPVEDWLARCKAAWPAIRSRVTADLAATSDEAYGALFLLGDDAMGIPARAGYYAGLRLVRELLEYHTVPEVAHWDRDVARSRIRDALAVP